MSRQLKRRRVITFSLVLVSIILLSGLVACITSSTGASTAASNVSSSESDKTAVNPDAVGNTLSPRDQFIAQTYFSHLYYYPDPDESLELLQEHVQGQDLLGAGKYDEAVVLLKLW